MPALHAVKPWLTNPGAGLPAPTGCAGGAAGDCRIEPEQVGLLINTSICKDFLEPSMASLIHGDVGLGPECTNFDLANACRR